MGRKMAKLSEMAAGMAAIVGIPPAHITSVARTLRANGLISTGGRGAGGAEMKPEDYCNLLLGIICNYPSNQSHEFINFSHKLLNELSADDEPFDDPKLPETLNSLYELGSFYEHVLRLITCAASGEIDKYCDQLRALRREPDLSVQVTRYGNKYITGTIRFYSYKLNASGDGFEDPDGVHCYSVYEKPRERTDKSDTTGIAEGTRMLLRRKSNNKDITYTCAISETTICYIGSMIRGEVKIDDPLRI